MESQPQKSAPELAPEHSSVRGIDLVLCRDQGPHTPTSPEPDVHPPGA